MQSASVLSQRIASAPTPQICMAYFQPNTTSRGKLIIEAELATRSVDRCASGNYGHHSIATLGSRSHDRSEAVLVQNGSDYDCDDFPNGASAQKFFLAAGGPVSDPNDLDRDGDGLACEWRTEVQRIASRSTPSFTRPSSVSSVCYTGQRGGTYTLTASGAKNYDRC